VVWVGLNLKTVSRRFNNDKSNAKNLMTLSSMPVEKFVLIYNAKMVEVPKYIFNLSNDIFFVVWVGPNLKTVS
jgi:hypothetical protein